MVGLTPAQRALLDRFQHDFPTSATPYADVARTLGLHESDVLTALQVLADAGIVARVGPIFRTGSVGASTLAAMAVPLPRLADVARMVGAHPGVNHNYAREHRFNLWFVAHARDADALAALLQEIETQTRLPAISLPLVREYHIDLGFPLDAASTSRSRSHDSVVATGQRVEAGAPWHVACALERGLPLVARPYAEIAHRAGLHGADGEARVCRHVRDWLAAGVIKRIGIVVRHRPLGFAANLMAVWEVPDRDVDRVGERLATEPAVTLCYRRAPDPRHWRYNLFCMLHGKDRALVGAEVGALVVRHALGGHPHARLWSITAFKQTGARHDGVAAHG
jgi:DNA-binding Lrp family transcriptional regulator